MIHCVHISDVEVTSFHESHELYSVKVFWEVFEWTLVHQVVYVRGVTLAHLVVSLHFLIFINEREELVTVGVSVVRVLALLAVLPHKLFETLTHRLRVAALLLACAVVTTVLS